MALQDYLQGINNATNGAQTDLSNATKDLTAVTAGAGSLPSKLREALNTKLNNNSDIINQQADTMQNYFNAPAQAREKYQNIFNPFEKEKLVTEASNQALRPYDVLSNVLSNRMGTVSDIVSSAVEGWKGMKEAASVKVDAAKSKLSTILQEYLQASNMQQAADELAFKQAQAEEAKRQFELNYGLDQKKTDQQNTQFYDELNNRLKIAGINNASKATTPQEQAKLTDAIWQSIQVDGDGKPRTPEQMWQIIHQNETSWSAMGVNMNTIWAGYKAAGGGSTPATASTPKSWVDEVKSSSTAPSTYNLIDPLAAYKGGTTSLGKVNFDFLNPKDPNKLTLGGK